MSTLFQLRPGERGITALALLFMTVLVASHTVLETARDALFLAHVPAQRLPVVYLAIGALSLVLSKLEARFLHGISQRVALVLWTALSALGTGVLCVLVPGSERGGDATGLYVLYVWSGLIGAIVLVHFWSMLGAALSVTQARRLYPLIGSGSVAGALLGSALASLLSHMLRADALVWTAAAGFGVSTGLAAWFAKVTPAVPPQAAPGARSSLPPPSTEHVPVPSDARMMDDVRKVARQPYVRSIALLLIVSSACLTLVDYSFKSSVARHVPAEELGTFFGGAALGLNLLSLICQLTISAWLLKRFDPAGVLSVLPALLALGGVGMLFGLGLPAALFGKGADGALRYSLHRTATELLYVPLPDYARPRIKAVLDLVAQRGGQALASLTILTLAGFGAARGGVALFLFVLAVLWAALAVALRKLYIGVLHANLQVRSAEAAEFPEFDMASLETLVSALDSQNDNEVLAALGVLDRERKLHIVPTLILHHPSETVVERALTLFTRARRHNALPVIERLLDHPAPRVRAAAIAARAMLQPEAAFLYRRLELEQSPAVKATIVVHLIASGALPADQAFRRIHHIVEQGEPAARCALAEAIAHRGDPALDVALVQLTAANEPEVRLSAIAAMAQHTSEAFLPALLDALADELTRAAAARTLRGHGQAGFLAVRAALQDTSHPPALRWELPRTLALFEPEPASRALVEQLTREEDGMVRYRIILALEGVIAKHPTLALDASTLEGVVQETIRRAYSFLDQRLTLEQGVRERPERKTPGNELLVAVLLDKERNARDRLLRLLGLLHPNDDFPRIRRSLRSASDRVRASSVELVSTLLREPQRSAVQGLIDDMPDAERFTRAGAYYQRETLGYETLLQHMLTHESEAVQDVTAFHVGELGLSALRPLIAAIAEADPSRSDLTRALSRFPALAGA